VTARAAARSRAPGSRTSLSLFVIVIAASAAPARAEEAATVSVFSDLRFRGYSLSEGRPVAILDFAYDDPSGLYADAAGTGVLRRGGVPAPLALQLTGGYAKRLRSATTLDFGVTHSTYASYSGRIGGTSYTEVYAGIARGALSSRIFLSPNYLEGGGWAAYGEVNGSVSPLRHWSIDGHVGVHVPLQNRSREPYRAEFDSRIGVTRELGRISLHADWSTGGPGYDFYHGRRRGRDALVLGASLVL
jgi:uncharacterized protein (TIGR02001 family)